MDLYNQLTNDQLNSTNRMNQLNNHFLHLMNQSNRSMDRHHLSEFNLQFGDNEQFYIPIESYEVLDRRTKFTVYKLKVENMRSGLYWFVYRRFTDFQRLNDKLKIKYPNLELNLPTKSIFDNVFNPIFIEKRQLGLQLYLNQLMSSKQLLKDQMVRRFLCIDDPPLQLNNSSSIPSSNITYPSSIYSDSCDQLFVCHNCNTLEKKLEEMQIICDEKDLKIRELENALQIN